MRTLAVLATALSLVSMVAPRALHAAHGRTFHTVLVGSEEAVPNESTARGTFTASLNADNTLTYSVSATGFETAFRFAHIHNAPVGVAGPILFFIDCDEEGMTCSGTSRALTTEELDLLNAEGLYVNMHTDAFPPGEIRGQLRSVLDVPPEAAASVSKFAGKASGFGAPKAEIKLKGRFFTSAPIDLLQSTSVALSVIDEVGGAGELLRGVGGLPILSVPLIQTRPDRRGKEAVYSTVAGGPDPICQLKLKNKGKGVFEFTLDCKKHESVLLPAQPTLCSSDKHPKTNLRTWLVWNAGTVLGLDITVPWSCKGRDGIVKELKAIELKNGPTGGGGTPAPAENRSPKADFRLDPDHGDAPLTVQFDNRSTDPDNDPLTSAWDFGDGATSTEEDPAHIYQEAGEYEVKLVVQDSRGATSAPVHEQVDVRADEQP